MSVTINRTGDILTVESPYHPDFPARARRLGGRWDSPTWMFDARDEERVRELCRDIYGTDGQDVDVVTVRLALSGRIDTPELYVAGRQILRRRHRDRPVEYGEGVVVLDGEFPDQAGSMKYPEIGKPSGSEGVAYIEIRDIPRAAVTAESEYDLEIVDAAIDHVALAAERERLLARVAEIDAVLDGSA